MRCVIKRVLKGAAPAMELKSLVARLQSTIAQSHVESVEALLEDVLFVQAGFRSLPRPRMLAGELVSLKFQMQHWRHKVLNLVLNYLQNTDARAAGAIVSCQILSQLELKPSSHIIREIAECLARHKTKEVERAASEYFATMNEPGFISVDHEKNQRLSGPSKILPIEANAPSRCTYEKWSQSKDLAQYQFEGEGVRYRGLHFLPGDALVCNVNRDGNGVYTALCSPRSYGYHMGVFAILTEGENRFPVILETYKLGVRAVPLCAFLREKVSSYVEVYRLKNRSEDFCSKLNEQAARLPQMIRGYNFDTEDKDRSYISCTTMGTHLYELSGGPTIQAKSAYLSEPTIQRNLDTFDFVLPAFLSMNDYMCDERMVCVGVVDNGHLESNVARELAERHFVTIFRNGVLDLSRLPFMFALNWFGVRQMRKGNILGKLIGLPYGLTQDNLPKGPEKVLAVIEVYEHLIEAAVKKLKRVISAHWDRSHLIDIDSLACDPAIEKWLASALAPIARGFPRQG